MKHKYENFGPDWTSIKQDPISKPTKVKRVCATFSLPTIKLRRK
jgi:hypothetical protein